MSAAIEMIGHGVYGIAEAAKLTGLHPGRLGRWFKGRSDHPEMEPFLIADYEPRGGKLAISFRDMVDAFIASQLYTHGVRVPTLRKVYRNLQQRFGGKHGFSHEELRTDGSTVFLHSLSDTDREGLVDLLNNQRVMPKVLMPFLRKLDFDPISKLAVRWRIADGVVVDPSMNFGKPVATGAGVSTHVLYRAYLANGHNLQTVSGWYDVDISAVRAAVAFEQGLAA
ncbi:MAG: DUF433 domain-containing protein [Planctomycetes bacterium]|nr:DUF433 domain-containing protein [Planctomycetota bacterium]